MSEPVTDVEREVGYPTALDEWGLPVEGPPMRKDQAKPALLLEESLARHAREAGALWHVAFNDRVDFLDAEGREEYVFPDVYVVVGIPPRSKGPFRTVAHGRAPDAAFEFSVPGSLGMDRREKQARYAAMGVRESFVFDVEARRVPELLEGWTLADGVYRPLEPVPSPLGGRRLASAALGLELEPVTDPGCPEGYALRAFLPGAAEPLPTPAEAGRDAAEAARGDAEAARDAATAERDAATAERDAATAERDAATAERDAAKRRVAELEEALRQLRDEGRGPG